MVKAYHLLNEYKHRKPRTTDPLEYRFKFYLKGIKNNNDQNNEDLEKKYHMSIMWQEGKHYAQLPKQKRET